MRKFILMLFIVAGFATLAKAQDTSKVKKTTSDPAAKEARGLQKKLNLTDDQTKQITAIIADRNGRVEDLKAPGNANRAQIDQVRADANTQIDVLLTPDQKKIFDQMIADQKARTTTQKFLIPTTGKKGF